MDDKKELKKFPVFKTDEEAERFVEEADLSEYDFSEFKPMSHYFEFMPKDKNINLRVPEALLEAVRARAEEKGISYQKYIRQVLEESLSSER